MRAVHASLLLLPFAAAACAPAATPLAVATPAPAVAAAPAASILSRPDADPKVELPALAELAKSGPTRAQFPQADAYVAVDRDDVSLAKDGTVTERHKSVVRILDSQRGKEKFADVHIPWDHDRETLTVVLARTVNPDGSAREVSDEETGDILPPELQGATVYANALERVVSFPAVDEGSVLELVWTRTTRPTADASLGDELPLAMWDPEKTRIVTVTVPAGAEGRFSVQGIDLAPVRSTDAAAGTQTWTWTETDVPDRQPERGAPAEAEVLPRLLYSFEPDWKTASAKMAERYRADPATLAAPVKAQADAIVATVKGGGEAARAQAIFKFVAQEIREIDLPLGRGGYAPNAPEKVLENRYADVRDKAALLLALCAAEKIGAEAVLARSEGVPVIEAVPTLAQFDHLYVRATVDGSPVWLDPSSHDAQYGIAYVGEDNFVLPLGSGSLEHRALPDPALSVSKIDETYTVDDGGDLHASLRYDATGWYANNAIGALRPYQGDSLAQHFQEATAKISAVALDQGHSVSDLAAVAGAFEVTHRYLAPGYAPAQGGFRVIELPQPTFSVFDDLPPTGAAQRQYPLVLTPPRTVDRTITVKLPAGWKIAWVPPALKGDENGFRYDTHCEPKESTVVCRDQIVLDAKQIPPDRYPAFHAALAKLDEYRERVILLTK